MELYRTQILLEKTQHEILTQIAQEENRSLSDIVREMIERELRYRQRHQMMLAAHELQAYYDTDPELNAFSALDSEDFLYGDDDNATG